jgi:hypothetical protein
MAATLYEPTFAVVGRAHDDPAARLRALGIVTLLEAWRARSFCRSPTHSFEREDGESASSCLPCCSPFPRG